MANTRNVRSAAAKKAARTIANRKAFIARYGKESFDAVVAIVNKRYVGFTTASLAAYKANLTRGTYSDFIAKTSKGYNDSMSLNRL